MNNKEAVVAIEDYFSELKNKYKENQAKKVNALVIGDYGTGKTSLAATCPKPVLFHSFDPGGTRTAVLQPFIENGDIIVESFELDDWMHPFAYKAWERSFLKLKKNNMFDRVGTYFLDSLTQWVVSLMYFIQQVGMGKGITGHAGIAPYLSDYLWQQLHAGNILRKDIMTLPCHVVCTGHLHMRQDDLTGQMHTTLLMWGKIADQIPLVFDEKWIARVRGIKHVLQTKSDGLYHAETRIGGGKFKRNEVTSFRYLLKKAGVPCEDKPQLFNNKTLPDPPLKIVQEEGTKKN